MLRSRLSPSSFILVSTLFIGSSYDTVQGHADSCYPSTAHRDQTLLAFSLCHGGLYVGIADLSKKLPPLSRSRPATALHVQAGMKDWIKKVVFGD
ncbi:hypothetical protein GUITHDRAFT_155082, partial [Guillardia theta CCMP2712]